MEIKIQNIYYLLCYAWNKLEEKDKINVNIDDQTELVDLFAMVLINASKVLLKRGIDRNYVFQSDELAGIKGKLAISDTLKSNVLTKQHTICQFDEFSPDILTNRILVNTLRKLLKIKKLDKELKSKIRSLLIRFPKIKTLHIKPAHFHQIRLHRNNQFYGFILDTCKIILENLLPSEEEGVLEFSDFIRDERKMNQLFEKFIFNFYRIEQKKFTVSSDRIYWQFEAIYSNHSDFLPSMLTDISLKSNEQEIIIDAKFYRETMSVYYGKKRIKSANLYQLFSYLLNQEDPEKPTTFNAKGILLYPTTQEEFNINYQYKTHPIAIKTINLNADWRSIRNRLLEIIG